jgi:uncharacterized membrane protein YbhN (UPF0104 family)
MKVKGTTEPVSPGITTELTTGAPAANNLRARLFFWGKILLTVTVLVLLIATIHPREIAGAFSGARYPLVVVSLILVIPNLGLRAMKWGYILRQVKPQASVNEIVSNLLIGFTFAVVTPGQLGEFGRAFFITGRPRLELIGLSFVDKIYNLIPIILGGSLGLLLLPGLLLGGNSYVFISSCILVGLLWLILSLILLSPRWIRDLFYAINVMLPYRDKIKVLLSGLDPIYIRQSLVMTGLGVAHYLVAIVQYYLLVLSFQAVGFFDSFRAAAATLFTKAALPISIGGLGVGETASVGFFRIFGVDQAAAFNSSVMLFTMNVLFPAVLGFFILLRQRIVQENSHV